MIWKILADLLVFFHFLFVIFMFVGFLLTFISVIGFYIFRRRGFFARFFGWSVFRWAHVCGIGFVGSIAAMGKYCPLSILENYLRRRAQDGGEYTGSFIIHYVEKILYPNVPPKLLLILTLLITTFTVLIFILRPPWREKSTNLKEKL